MADAIVRLKVESQEYDSKLERATQKLQHMEKECRKIGGTFEYVDKEQMDLVKSLGQMETKATTARGKVAEMTKSYTELSLQYKRLSDQEKQSPFGKAMAQSLDQLKSRIKDTNAELKDVSQELGSGSNGLGGIMETLAGRIGIPVEMFTKLGAAAAGVGAALKVATDALKQNEEFMDEWGRVTSSAQSLYQGFLDVLNTGDITGYLSRIDDIVQAARDAYDALDELGTFQAFNQINTQKALTQWTQAIADFREGSITKEQAKQFAEAYKDQLRAQQTLQQDVYEKAIIDMAQTHKGVDPAMLKEALSGTYGDYKALKELSMPTVSVWNSDTRSFNDVIDRSAATEQQLLGEMLRELTDEELDALQKLGLQAEQTATQIASVDRTVVRMLGTGGKGGIVKAEEVLPAGSIAEVKARIAELNKAYEMAGDATTRDRIRIQIEDLKRELEMMSTPLTGLGQVVPLSVELLDTSKEKLAADMEELLKRLGLEPIKLGVEVGTDGKGTVETAKQTEKAWGAAANAISAIGGALQQIEDPSAKVAGIIMQAVANIALGFAQAAASPATGAAGVFGWIAAAKAGVATMASTIASIKSVTKGGFANGGIVPGNSFSGDNLHTSDYGINSGELILNRSQQNVIASQLQGGAAQNMRLEALISGESLRMVLANNASRRGGNRAQYAISKFG
ncbi:MAG: hypothetical protein UH084_08155 [Paludibacteraceae bacterium]|nr:hypothetical protein [Paludibacteraceae bacterium]